MTKSLIEGIFSRQMKYVYQIIYSFYKYFTRDWICGPNKGDDGQNLMEEFWQVIELFELSKSVMECHKVIRRCLVHRGNEKCLYCCCCSKGTQRIQYWVSIKSRQTRIDLHVILCNQCMFFLDCSDGLLLCMKKPTKDEVDKDCWKEEFQKGEVWVLFELSSSVQYLLVLG